MWKKCKRLLWKMSVGVERQRELECNDHARLRDEITEY